MEEALVDSQSRDGHFACFCEKATIISRIGIQSLFFYCLDLYHKLPDSGELQCKPRALKRRSDSTLRAGGITACPFEDKQNPVSAKGYKIFKNDFDWENRRKGPYPQLISKFKI